MLGRSIFLECCTVHIIALCYYSHSVPCFYNIYLEMWIINMGFLILVFFAILVCIVVYQQNRSTTQITLYAHEGHIYAVPGNPYFSRYSGMTGDQWQCHTHRWQLSLGLGRDTYTLTDDVTRTYLTYNSGFTHRITRFWGSQWYSKRYTNETLGLVACFSAYHWCFEWYTFQ